MSNMMLSVNHHGEYRLEVSQVDAQHVIESQATAIGDSFSESKSWIEIRLTH